MSFAKVIFSWVVLITLLPLAVSLNATAQTPIPSPTSTPTPDPYFPPNGSTQYSTNIRFSWPARAGAAYYRLSAYKLLWDAGTDAYVEKLILSKNVTGNFSQQDLVGQGSPTILWKIRAFNSAGQALSMGDPITGTLRSFILHGFGPTMEFIPKQQNALGVVNSFKVNLDFSNSGVGGSGYSAIEGKDLTEKMDSRGLRSKFKSCVKDRLSRALRSKKSAAEDLDTAAFDRNQKARKARAKAHCKASLKEQESRLVGKETPDNYYSLKCFSKDPHSPGQYVQMEICPSGMSIDNEGNFTFASIEPAEILVQIIYDDGNTRDSQFFTAVAVSQPVGSGGVAGLLTYLADFAGMLDENGDPVNFVIPDYRDESSSASGTYPYWAIDGWRYAPEVWMPNQNTWSITVTPNGDPGQQMNLVEKMWIRFGDRAGSVIPNPSDIVVEYTTKTNPSSEDFIAISNQLELSPLLPNLQCTELSPECEGAVDIMKQLTHVRIRGVNPTANRPSFVEIGFFGWRGKDDCAPTDDLKWRREAYLDLNGDKIPDTLTLVNIPSIRGSDCYGAASDLTGSGYVAPEEAIHPPFTCPSDPNLMIPGECGYGYRNRPCYQPGDFTCDGKVDLYDFSQLRTDLYKSDPNIIRRYCRHRNPGDFSRIDIPDYQVLLNHFHLSCLGGS